MRYLLISQKVLREHHLQDSFNMNTLNRKVTQKINSLRIWSSRKAEFLRKIASFPPVKFEYVNYTFPIRSISFTFNEPEEYWFRMFS